MQTRQWHLTPEGYSCWKAECDCPGPPSRLVERLVGPHPGLLLLVAVVALLLLRG